MSGPDLALVAIISAGRPGNVPAMAELARDVGPVVWFVPEGEGPDYRYCGADQVVESGALCASRNAALEAAAEAGSACLQLSDDLRSVAFTSGTTRADVRPAKLREVVVAMVGGLQDTGAQLAGVAPTANPFYSRQRIKRDGFVVGDMCLIAAGCPLRWDETLRLKEDYDYTCQHLATYGTVARLDWVLANFAHRKNKGGAVAVRTPELEQQSIAYLQGKWPGVLHPNPRRPNEVLLRWRPDQPLPAANSEANDQHS